VDQSKKGAVAPAGMLHSLRSGPFCRCAQSTTVFVTECGLTDFG
jgi:hypothetical protein